MPSNTVSLIDSKQIDATNGNRMLIFFSFFCFIYKIEYNSVDAASHINIALIRFDFKKPKH